MAKATISYRIGLGNWLEDKNFEVFWAKLSRLGRGFDEIALSINLCHGPEPLSVMAPRLEKAISRLEFIRRQRYRAGINNLTTIGHMEEKLEMSIHGFTNLCDPQGRICRNAFCMNDERYLKEYLQPLYRMIAGTRPDFIWVDDDVRLEYHHPISNACFCDHCLELFGQRNDRKWTRETFSSAFNAGDEYAMTLRREWLAFNRETIVRCLTAVEQAVHGVDPTIELGQMTGEHPYEGYAFDEWEQALSGPAGTPVMWRPGGGFYWEDSSPVEMPCKAHAIGRQIAYLSPRVQRIESEIENCPCYRLYKSRRVTGVEAACHIAAGCTGVAYNVLRADGYLDEREREPYEVLLQELADKRFFHDAMVEDMGRSPAVGVHSGWSKDIYVAAGWDKRDWLNAGVSPLGNLMGGHMEWLHMLGIPPAYHPDHALVTALSGANVRAMDDTALRQCLSGGVYMDGDALAVFTDRGVGSLCGFALEKCYDNDALERFSDHPVNGGRIGWLNNCHQAFWKAPAWTLRPLNCRATMVSQLETSNGINCGTTIGLYENELGGRICVAGYGPWRLSASLTKVEQIRRIFSWLSGDRLGGIESYHKAQLWIRGGVNGAAAVVNLSMDDARDIVVRLPATVTRRSILSYEGDKMELSGTPCGPEMVRYTLPFVKSLSITLIR